ncbi:hypothetical protein QCA50_007333 [Cerrena zonata]|uniref:Uncharacterized protein n=1 Tax=Cerrena zonata TaxID=2478898 RepID=A0AAW0G866_9APHY
MATRTSTPPVFNDNPIELQDIVLHDADPGTNDTNNREEQPRGPSSDSDSKLVMEFETPLFWSFLKLTGLAGLCYTVAAVMPTILLLWILSGVINSKTIPHDKAFLVHKDGNSRLGGHGSTHLLGLVIASISARVIGLLTSAVVSFYAYWVARRWLNPSISTKSLPSSLQYGLLLSLLSNPGLGSLFQAAWYSFKRSKRNRKNKLLTHALIVTTLILGLTYAITGADLWLHAVTTTSAVTEITPTSEPFKYGIGQNTCYPYPDVWVTAGLPCLLFPGKVPNWNDGIPTRAPGMAVASNVSDDLQVITLADANDLAVLVRPNIPQSHVFRGTSFGARASCESVTQKCDRETLVSCDGFTPDQFPPISALHWDPEDPGKAEVVIQSANCAPDVVCEHVNSTEWSEFAFPNTTWPPVNRYNLWMQFIWHAEEHIDWGTVPSGNQAIWTSGSRASILTNCTLQFFNVTLDYSGGRYSLVDQSLSNVGLADGLAGPTRLGHFNPQLVSDVSSRAFLDNSTEEFLAFLNQDLARLALASTAIITNVSTDTLSHSILSSVNVARYPLAPVVTLLTLLYLYATAILLIYGAIGLWDRSGMVGVSGDPDKNTVRTLALTHLWLTSVLPVVSRVFPPELPDSEVTALSIRTNEIDMFGEDSENQTRHGRLQPGVDFTANGGQVFAIHKRKRASSEDDPESLE